jgi:hypothetical protein
LLSFLTFDQVAAFVQKSSHIFFEIGFFGTLLGGRGTTAIDFWQEQKQR